MNKRRWLHGAWITLVVVCLGTFVAMSQPPGSVTPAPDPVAAAQPAQPAEPATEAEYESFSATAYSDFGITFSGVLVQRGIVAADPTILPIGSVIEVKAGPYSGIYVVMDTGAVVKGRLIDIYLPDEEEAIQFGRQEVRIRVLRRGWHPEAVPSFEYSLAG